MLTVDVGNVGVVPGSSVEAIHVTSGKHHSTSFADEEETAAEDGENGETTNDGGNGNHNLEFRTETAVMRSGSS